jgi:hypothetical protein
MFGPTSRYYGLPTTTIERADGTRIVYVRRRFVPPPERFELLLEHTVAEGERLDHIAARYLGDPEQYWRIADANAAMQPDDLVSNPGERVRITLPEGISGAKSF